MKVAADAKDVKFEHATGYKTAPNMRTYDSRTYEGAYMAGIIAGGMTKSNTLGVVGSIPIPEVIRNINSFTLGAQSVNPKIKTKVVWVNEWFNPPKETEAAHRADQRRRRRADAEHRFARRAEDRAGEGQARLRLGQRHDGLRPEGAPGLGGDQLGAVLHEGRGRCAGGQVVDRQGLVGRQGRRDRLRLDRRRGAGRTQGQGGEGQGRACRTAASRSGRARSSTTPARRCSRRTRSPTTSACGGVKFYVKGVEGKVPGDK